MPTLVKRRRSGWMEAAGFPACPADAPPPARRAAQVILTLPSDAARCGSFVERVLALNAGG